MFDIIAIIIIINIIILLLTLVLSLESTPRRAQSLANHSALERALAPG